MALYLVTYDVHQDDDEYEKLYAALAKLRAVRALESVWFVDYAGAAKALRHALQQHLDGNESILIAELDSLGDWSSRGLRSEAVDWIKAKIG